MTEEVIKLFQQGGGEFISPPSLFAEKLKGIKAILFDWDGVFNDGFKSGQEGSPFSEVDAMGTNLLRYALWTRDGRQPSVGIITGENNPSAVTLGNREHFHELFLLAKDKKKAFEKFCETRNVRPEEVLFFFDDVLDLEVARRCGLRMMIKHQASVMLKQFVVKNKLVDYRTGNSGGQHGLREGCELVIGMLGLYDEVVNSRMIFSEAYQAYLTDRQRILTSQIHSSQ